MLVFICERKNGVRLRSAACGDRYEAARAEGRPGVMKLDDETCRTCPIGRAHRDGKAPSRWPDGTPIVRVELKPRGTLHEET